MIQGLGIKPRDISGYELVQSPKIDWDNDFVNDGRTYEYVYRAVPQEENAFTDVNKSDYFYDAVLWAVENGITTGKTETTFLPNEGCTRSQIVTFLYRQQNNL